MKTDVERLEPTRVRLTVEVPFDELDPAMKAAYRKVAQQVRIPGFRPGKVPPRVIDQRVGRAAVLEEAVNNALPEFYGKAVEESAVQVLGQPHVDVTAFADGEPLTFTAEVEVKPEIALPEYKGLEVTVDPVTVTDEEVDEQLGLLRERFAVLSGANRPVESGDYVSIDLSATVAGTPVEDAVASGLSYEVGGDSLVPGLDDALLGMSEGDQKVFPSQLRVGDHAGDDAEVSVTVRSVKAKQVPELDDEFAQTASEFDTIDELRGDYRNRMQRLRGMEQGVQARDHVLDALLERTEVPLPPQMLQAEISYRRDSIQNQLDSAGLTRAEYAEIEAKTEEELDTELVTGAEQAVRAQFVLDAVADAEEITVTNDEFSEQLVRRAMRAGISPDQYFQSVMQQGAVPFLVAELRRGKALALVLEAATVTDTEGKPVDISALREDSGAESGAAAVPTEAEPVTEAETAEQVVPADG